MTKPKAKLLFNGIGLTKEEQEYGNKKFVEYLKTYPQLNKSSNLHLLEELVWLECVQDRYKAQIGEVTRPGKNPDGTSRKAEPIPRHLTDAISEGLSKIIELKTKLGLFEDQKVLDAYKVIEDMKAKSAEYRKQHPLSFQTACPFCSKIFFLKRRTDKYDPHASPFFPDDKVLKNTPLRKLWIAGKITKEEYAEVLGVSSDYPEWLEEHVYKSTKKI